MNEKDLFRAASASALPDRSEIKLAAVSSASRHRRIRHRIPALAMSCAIAIFICALAPSLIPAKAPSAPHSNAISLYSPEQYGEVYEVLSALSYPDDYYYFDDVFMEGADSAPSVVPSAPTTGITGATGDTAVDFSDTNLQVAGVQEADIVKTDGRYIYALKAGEGTVTIVAVNDGNPEVTSVITLPQFEDHKRFTPGLMYIRGDRLIVLGDLATPYVFENGNAFLYGWRATHDTMAIVYDLSDRSSPVLLDTLSQSGSLVDSRMIGNVLYLVSEYTVRTTPVKEDPTTYIPMTSVGDECYTVAPGDICIPQEPAKRSGYTVVSGYTVDEPAIVSTKSLLGRTGTVYCSENNLYLTAHTSESVEEIVDGAVTAYSHTYCSDISRFSLDNGTVELTASARIPGHLLNQFSLDEYDGYLRVVTTCYTYGRTVENGGYVYNNEQTNALYVLDSELNTVGSITGLAADERVYSVRFMGELGYFVTFRQVDPLFAVDLSDPTSPMILSALKIPGFSEYLHPYADGLLLGLGKNADERTGRSGCLKLSMFDVSDPTNVTEHSKLDISDVYWAEASSNHKAIVVSAEKDLIGFAADGIYRIYGYGEDGFTERAALSLSKLDYYGVRGMYIGEYFYVVSTNGIITLSLEDMSVVSTLSF